MNAGDPVAVPVPDVYVGGVVLRRLVLVEVPGIHGQREISVLLRDRGQPSFGNRRPCVQVPPNSCGIRTESGDEGLGAVQRTTPVERSDRQTACRVVADLRRVMLFASRRPPFEGGQYVTYLRQDIRRGIPDQANESPSATSVPRPAGSR